jgi:ERCC4-type nuclease
MFTKLKSHSTPYMYSELDKHLCSVENIKNVILIRSTSKMETVWQVINRHQWWQKEWDEHNSADPIKLQAEISFAYITECRRFATGLPGVGWKKSAELAAVFGTIEQCVLASVEELTKVVGPALAAKLYAHMRTYK